MGPKHFGPIFDASNLDGAEKRVAFDRLLLPMLTQELDRITNTYLKLA